MSAPMRREAERDQHRQRDEGRDAADAGLEVHAGREARPRGRRSAESSATTITPREVAEQQRRALHRRHRQALEEAGLDVARERRARR